MGEQAHQNVNFRRVASLGSIDRLLREVIAQYVERVHGEHALGAFLPWPAFGQNPFTIARQPGVRRVTIGKKIHEWRERGACGGAQILADALRGRFRQAGCVCQLPEAQREIGVTLMHQSPEVVDQLFVACAPIGEAEFRHHPLLHGFEQHRLKTAKRRAQRVVAGHKISQAAGQANQVPLRDRRLRVPCVASVRIRVIANMARVKGIHEPIRPVVKRQAENRHVVGVHDAMAKPHDLPCGHQLCRALDDRLQQVDVRRCGVPASRFAARRIMPVDDVIRQGAKIIRSFVGGPVLKRAKAHERRCHAGHDGRRLDRFTKDGVVGGDQGERTRGRDPEPLHGFAREVLAHG